MIVKSSVLRFMAFSLIVSFIGVTSCNDEEPQQITLQDTADLTDEALTDAYFQDIEDIAGVAMGAPSDTEYSGGRISSTITIEDHRFDCDGISVTVVPDETSTRESPKGILTIDFGSSGCSDFKGNLRKGKLIFTYSGTRFMPGSSVIATTENYFINDIKLEGVRTLTNVQSSSSDAPRFNAVLTDGKATFPNGMSASRQADITWQWNRATNPADDNLQIEDNSEASGVTRLGRSYEVDVVEPLVYKRHCGIPVSGIKRYLIDGEKEITIDYGDGTCDREFSITLKGVTRVINF